jgi:hypothetical protein
MLCSEQQQHPHSPIAFTGRGKGVGKEGGVSFWRFATDRKSALLPRARDGPVRAAGFQAVIELSCAVPADWKMTARIKLFMGKWWGQESHLLTCIQENNITGRPERRLRNAPAPPLSSLPTWRRGRRVRRGKAGTVKNSDDGSAAGRREEGAPCERCSQLRDKTRGCGCPP